MIVIIQYYLKIWTAQGREYASCTAMNACKMWMKEIATSTLVSEISELHFFPFSEIFSRSALGRNKPVEKVYTVHPLFQSLKA